MYSVDEMPFYALGQIKEPGVYSGRTVMKIMTGDGYPILLDLDKIESHSWGAAIHDVVGLSQCKFNLSFKIELLPAGSTVTFAQE